MECNELKVVINYQLSDKKNEAAIMQPRYI